MVVCGVDSVVLCGVLRVGVSWVLTGCQGCGGYELNLKCEASVLEA